MIPARTIACTLLLALPTPPASADPAPFGRLAAVLGAPPADAAAFRLLAHVEAARAGLPYALVDAVMKIESDYRPDRIGDVGEIGLMQVRPGTAAMLGFSGTDRELADPAVNIHYGVTYLGQAWKLAGGDVCRTLMKYRAGHGEEIMSPLSAAYCARARDHLAAVGSPLAATITAADLIAAPLAVSPAKGMAKLVVAKVVATGRAPRLVGRTGKGFWTAFQARIRRIDARIESRWRRKERIAER